MYLDMVALAVRDQVLAAPVWLLNSYLGVEEVGLVLASSLNLFLDVWEQGEMPAGSQSLYLDVLGLESVVVALFLLAEWDLDLVGPVPCPGYGLIDA